MAISRPAKAEDNALVGREAHLVRLVATEADKKPVLFAVEKRDVALPSLAAFEHHDAALARRAELDAPIEIRACRQRARRLDAGAREHGADKGRAPWHAVMLHFGVTGIPVIGLHHRIIGAAWRLFHPALAERELIPTRQRHSRLQ